LKRTRPFILTNLHSLYPRIICTKFSDFDQLVLEKIFKKCSVYFYSFTIISLIISPLFKQTWIPSSKNNLCQVWLKLAQWFWRRSQKCKSFQTSGQTDGQRVIRKANLSFQLRLAKNDNVRIFSRFSLDVIALAKRGWKLGAVQVMKNI
jgi:hypothetical protein